MLRTKAAVHVTHLADGRACTHAKHVGPMRLGRIQRSEASKCAIEDDAVTDGDTAATALTNRVDAVEDKASDLDTRVTAAKTSADNAATAADAAKTTADGALPKAGGTVTGALTVTGNVTFNGATNKAVSLGLGIPGSGGVSGALDVRTGAGGILFRTANFSGSDEGVIDWVNNVNSAFGGGIYRATQHSFITTTGSRAIIRGSGSVAFDAVNTANNAFAPMSMTATGFTMSGGNLAVGGNITASGSITPSDERLKEHIEARQVTRGMALSLAKAFAEWDLIATGEHQVGVVAQVAQGICPIYVVDIDYTPPPTFVEGTTEVTYYPSVKRLGVNQIGMALEASMDNALDIADLKDALTAALQRIAALEAR